MSDSPNADLVALFRSHPNAVCPECGERQRVLSVWATYFRIARHLDGRGHMCPETKVPHSGSSEL